MKKRARGEIRVAERHGVIVEPRDARTTRTGSACSTSSARPRSARGRSSAASGYLERGVARRSSTDDRGHLYFAWHDGQVVAGAFVARYGANAWYKDGGSTPRPAAADGLAPAAVGASSATSPRDGIERYDLGHVPPPGEPDAPGPGRAHLQERASRATCSSTCRRSSSRTRTARERVAARRERVPRPRTSSAPATTGTERRSDPTVTFAYSSVSNPAMRRATVIAGGSGCRESTTGARR